MRKTWELDATEFQLLNPGWTAFSQEIVAKSLRNLGVQVETSVEPYKLLLYEEGVFFKAHRDTEKTPGMFGTLV